MGKYFGTDGFRGEANKELTVEHAYKVGRFLERSIRRRLLLARIPEEAVICLSTLWWQA